MLNIIKASAGSGKTYSLTKEYLRLLLGVYDPETGRWSLRRKPAQAHRGILAITFTNKATQEMTRRIIDELAILGCRDPYDHSRSPYLDDFAKDFGVDPANVVDIASATLDDLLFDFAFFHVSTIDAFFQNVLRVFAREIEMPDNFDLELDNNFTITVGVNEILASINYRDSPDPLRRKEQQWLNRWLTGYMMRMIDEGQPINLFSRSSRLYSKLVARFTALINEDFKFAASKIVSYLTDIARVEAFEKALDADLAKRRARVAADARRIVGMADFTHVLNYPSKFIQSWAADDAVDKPVKSVVDAVASVGKRYKKAYVDKIGVDPGFDALVGSVLVQGVEYADAVALRKIMTEALSTLGLLGCLLRHVEDYCKDNNLIMLSETNSLLREIINNDDTPFVYERLGYYLRHFLIDEFQDTSKMQWHNLKPLVMESLSHDHPDLIIGDEKQCIYRFRNSDPELLGHEVADQVGQVYGYGAVNVEGTDIEHNRNWRSSSNVVRFNNTLFHFIPRFVDARGNTPPSSPASAAATFSNVIQQIDPRRHAPEGHVKLFFYSATDAESRDAECPRPESKTEGTAKERYDSFALATMVDELNRLLAAGYRPKDIAILVRSHVEGEAAINRILALDSDPLWPHGKVEVMSTDSVNISSSNAVQLIINILRLSQTPEYVDGDTPVPAVPDSAGQPKVNPAYLRARLLQRYEYFLHTPVMGLDGEKSYLKPSAALAKALDLMRDQSELSVDDLVARQADEEQFAADNSTREDALDFPSLQAVVDRIINLYIPGDAAREETIFLTAFQDLVYDFCQRGTADIQSFLRWWDNGGCRSRLASSPDTDAVNIMTIHQSKGLEFPCVIIPFADWDLVKESSPAHPSYGWYGLDSSHFPNVSPELVPPFLPLENFKKLCSMPTFGAQATDYFNRQRVDALNVAYVAFTRAVNELIVVTSLDKSDKDDSENLGSFIIKSVDAATVDAIAADQALTDKDRQWVIPLAANAELQGATTSSSGEPNAEAAAKVLELGSPTAPEKKKKAASETVDFPLPAYNSAVNTAVTTLSETDLDFFDFDDPRHRGQFLHRVMSKVRGRSQLPLALRRAAYRARLTPAQTEYCRQILEKAIADPRVAPWFDAPARILTEATILDLPAAEFPVAEACEYRPDRIVWQPDGSVDIIDYKFGEHNDKYYKQVERYIRLLRRAGHKTVRGHLWYPLTAIILPVTAP